MILVFDLSVSRAKVIEFKDMYQEEKAFTEVCLAMFLFLGLLSPEVVEVSKVVPQIFSKRVF